MSVEITPFVSEMIPEAAGLLAQQHQKIRTVYPELPVRFEDPAIAQKAIEMLARRPRAGGFAALQQGRLLGYLIGDIVLDAPWERSGWVRFGGCALSPEAEIGLIGDLYAALGARWVAYGCFAHFALIPIADPDWIETWFRLCFGVEQVHALAMLAECDLTLPNLPPDMTIRQSGAADREILADHSRTIRVHLTQPPVWGVALPELASRGRESYAEMADDDEATVWLAFQGERSVGIQAYFPAEMTDDNLLAPEQCIELCVGSVLKTHRRQGISRALTRYGLAHARIEGYQYCLTDWRSANLAAARCWPRQGFRPVVYRLVRRIDSRIAWANGNTDLL